MKWKTRDAEHEQARQAVTANLPPCPACGAPAEIDLINVTTFDGPIKYLVQSDIEGASLDCSARCWEHDPVTYLAAVWANLPAPTRPNPGIPEKRGVKPPKPPRRP